MSPDNIDIAGAFARCAGIAMLCWIGFAVPAAAAAKNSVVTLRIGPIKILCIKAPCPPWNAMAISRGVEPAGPNPLYLGPLPSINGTKVARSRIARTWREKSCVIIRGRLDRPRKPALLFVERILRSC